MEFSNAALCGGKRGGGGGVSCKHAHTRARSRPELLRPLLLHSYHQLLTFAAGTLRQGFSVAIQRALAALDNVITSPVMGCVIQQPPSRSIKEWHQVIPTWDLHPPQKRCPAQLRVLAAPRGAGLGAGLPLLSHSSDFSL